MKSDTHTPFNNIFVKQNLEILTSLKLSVVNLFFKNSDKIWEACIQQVYKNTNAGKMYWKQFSKDGGERTSNSGNIKFNLKYCVFWPKYICRLDSLRWPTEGYGSKDQWSVHVAYFTYFLNN